MLISAGCACLLLATAPALAATWLEVTGGEKSKVSIDINSMAPIKGYWKVWVKTDFEEYQSTQTYPVKKFKQVKYLQYFNCKEKTYTTTQWHAYGDDGDVVESTNSKLNAGAFTDLVPDSIGDSVFSFVCRGKK